MEEEKYIESVTPLGGNFYIVSLKPSPIDKILFEGKGKIIQVYAKNREEAIRKALNIARRKRWL